MFMPKLCFKVIRTHFEAYNFSAWGAAKGKRRSPGVGREATRRRLHEERALGAQVRERSRRWTSIIKRRADRRRVKLRLEMKGCIRDSSRDATCTGFHSNLRTKGRRRFVFEVVVFTR
ncbi:hypothetical protein LshimejAT787_1700350 [Lyophyllum shimeji]|uniref:Uncharacterized protein n=1 Tax=Lyophyllum shimeji TaxID=47721 RepID=A0A9P3UT99_LYOSH|nr:hypothetical protein LshimejAT787_1700350 [Lyophyllum shimeji]